jgi:hypothetical protein
MLVRMAKTLGKPVSEIVNDVVKALVGRSRSPLDSDTDFATWPKTGIGTPSPAEGRRRPGSLKGQIRLRNDFDAPLDDFEDYV